MVWAGFIWFILHSRRSLPQVRNASPTADSPTLKGTVVVSAALIRQVNCQSPLVSAPPTADNPTRKGRNSVIVTSYPSAAAMLMKYAGD
ncbi:hypothetical protein D3C86_2047990 [compost metagenome]